MSTSWSCQRACFSADYTDVTGFMLHTFLNLIIWLPYLCLLCQLDFILNLLTYFISQSKEWLLPLWCSPGTACLMPPVVGCKAVTHGRSRLDSLKGASMSYFRHKTELHNWQYWFSKLWVCVFFLNI